jgi:hypothetical protein
MLTAFALAAALSLADDPCPLHAQHTGQAHAAEAPAAEAHAAGVEHRHDTFGMSHDATRHSFRLFADGGAIELRANAADDTASIEAIRKHLQEVAAQFGKNDFATPAFVHGHAPDGVAEMKRLHDAIDYRYEEVAAGGRIRITTKSPAALAAVHDFLRFQVTEHRTENSGKVEADK